MKHLTKRLDPPPPMPPERPPEAPPLTTRKRGASRIIKSTLTTTVRRNDIKRSKP